jgi:hypothetical protein
LILRGWVGSRLCGCNLTAAGLVWRRLGRLASAGLLVGCRLVGPGELLGSGVGSRRLVGCRLVGPGELFRPGVGSRRLVGCRLVGPGELLGPGVRPCRPR